MKSRLIGVIFMFLLLALLPMAHAQTISGQISGSVADSGGAVIVGVKVQLISDLAQQVREFKTDSNGSFEFTGLMPGTYSLRIAENGFKAYAQPAIEVGAQERVDLHEIKLTVGDVNTSVSVSADSARVATDSSDRAITVNQRQIEDTPMAGRDFLSILRSLPGTAETGTNDSRGLGGNGPGVNGSPGQLLVTLDGIASQDSGQPRTNGYLSPSVDAIGEVKVLVGNYTAEYGARGGGQMNVTIKNGTRQFHGTIYDYYRHESLNANSFFNNKNTVTINGISGQATPKGKYRYQNPGGTIGGPVVIPGTRFNRERTKLFFFFSWDYLHNVGTNGPNRFTMPTTAERNGDFSQTVTSAGVLIPINDPLNGGQAFPNNMIPASRISPIGAALLNLFPNPSGPNGAVDLTGRRGYNTQFQFTNANPRDDKILRMDYSIGPKTTTSVRLIKDYQGQDGPGASTGPAGVPYGRITKYGYDIPSAGVVLTVIHTFRPNLLNEFTWGINRGHQTTPVDPKQLKDNSLPALKTPDGSTVTLPNFFGANLLNLIPNIQFGTTGAQSAGQGITGSAPNFAWDSRFPFDGTDEINSITDNLTWIKGRHSVKFGFYFEHDSRNVSVFTTYNPAGTYWFGSDTSNPNDTGYAYSNLLTGAVQAYGEDNTKQVNHARYKQYEWFAQDAWKLSRRVTLDLGLRFVSTGPVYSSGATLGVFDAAAYNKSNAGQLLYPACTVDVPATGSCPAASKLALNLVTGATYLSPRATSFDPASYPAGGTPFSGIHQYKTNFFHTPPIQLAPRIGLAWDVFGNGKTALRTGFGIFYDRAYGVDTIGNLQNAPPFQRAPIFYNTTFTNLLSTQGFLAPQNVNGGSQDYPPPSVYTWSFGFQQDLGKGTILDVAYVGNIHHHGFGTATDVNAVPPFTTWRPTPDATTTPGGQVLKYLDPTSGNGGTSAFYATNLIRNLAGGYQGYGSINAFTSVGEGYYDALQVQVNRRFGRRLQFGTNYTWQKTINYNHNQWLSDYLTRNVSGRPHAVNINFGYKIPSGSRVWKNAATQAALDGWNINGVGSLYMGNPLTIGCSATNTPIGYWTGTPTNAPGLSCQMNGALWLPNGSTPSSPGSVATTADPRLWYPLNASNFVLPGVNSFGIGNTPPTLFYGPGFENWDLSMYKEFRLGRDARILQFRAEAFNTFNHFNPNNPDTGLSYNFQTGAQTNGNFGRITSAVNSARRLSLSLRIRF